MGDKPVISVIEEIKAPPLSELLKLVYEPEFWYPFVPLDHVELKRLDDSDGPRRKYSYYVKSRVYMDAMKTIPYDFESSGTIDTEELGEQQGKGYLWKISVSVEKPHEATVGLNLRVKEIAKGLKVGFFIYTIDFDLGVLEGLPFGRDAVLFAGRVYLREAIKNFEKKYPQIYK